MNKLKIAVYAICKNEEKFVEGWMDSMQEADMVIVTDTGSTDNTIAKLTARGAAVYTAHVDPWRFDVARNISLNFVPEDIDICVCTDLDEILDLGWREKLEKIWTPDTKRLNYMYTWEFKEDGAPGVTYWRDKIHYRTGYHWVYPVHETLHYDGEPPEVIQYCEDIHLNHFPDNTKSRGQYLPLLELSVKENPENSSMTFWLGREYMFSGQYDQCIETLTGHLQLGEAVWDEERCASMRYIAKCYRAKKDSVKAKKWLYAAISECPQIREPYVEMAYLGNELKEWPLLYHMVEETLEIKSKQDSYLAEDFCWDYSIYDLGSIACYHLGLLKKSYEFAKIAADMNPKDERLVSNLKILHEKVKVKA